MTETGGRGRYADADRVRKGKCTASPKKPIFNFKTFNYYLLLRARKFDSLINYQTFARPQRKIKMFT